MKNRAHDLSTYAFKQAEALLLDTNVWLYLFPAPSARLGGPVASYTAAFKKISGVKSLLIMDALVLREYLDVYSRIEWNALYRKRWPDPKTFRLSPSFGTVGQSAATYARRMLKLCQRHDYPFADCDVDRVVSDFEAGASDITDGLLAETCRRHGWKLVTNDGDFTDGGIDVVTANEKLLKACA